MKAPLSQEAVSLSKAARGHHLPKGAVRMDIEAKCPYCQAGFVFGVGSIENAVKDTPTQTCPNCQAIVDTRLLLSLRAGGYGVRKVKPMPGVKRT